MYDNYYLHVTMPIDSLTYMFVQYRAATYLIDYIFPQLH